ncbi:hypothetical protein GPX89_28005 [Nocardia sp. ET3-3]|uniref:Integral membrane protein n=1 Tax=Nocardia terrae TaxID=2675851 RepID=A0A7K1V3Q5_9NOCA|nr:hypothetical protein [Nocardia terrae]
MAEQNKGEQKSAGETEVVPTTVRVAGALVAFEGALGLVAMVVLIVVGADGSAQSPKNSYLTAGYAAILGGAVLAAGIGLMRGKRWGRAIATLTQLLLLGVAYYMFTSDRPEFGAPLGLLALGALGSLFAPASNRWMAAGYGSIEE